MPQVTKTVRAEQDLDEIWFFIALDNVEAADNLLDNVDSSCQLLAIQPRAGAPPAGIGAGVAQLSGGSLCCVLSAAG